MYRANIIVTFVAHETLFRSLLRSCLRLSLHTVCLLSFVKPTTTTSVRSCSGLRGMDGQHDVGNLRSGYHHDAQPSASDLREASGLNEKRPSVTPKQLSHHTSSTDRISVAQCYDYYDTTAVPGTRFRYRKAF